MIILIMYIQIVLIKSYSVHSVLIKILCSYIHIIKKPSCTLRGFASRHQSYIAVQYLYFLSGLPLNINVGSSMSPNR